MLIAGLNELISRKPNPPRLPTAALLQSLYCVVENVILVDRVTGKPLPDSTPPTGGLMGGGEGGGMGGGMEGGFGGGNSAYYVASPPLEQFMRIGHLLWLDLLGVVGGWFAYLIVKRNKRDTAERLQSASP
jgi:hypothetical protein